MRVLLALLLGACLSPGPARADVPEQVDLELAGHNAIQGEFRLQG